MYGWMYWWMDGKTDEWWMEEWVNEYTNGWMNWFLSPFLEFRESQGTSENSKTQKHFVHKSKCFWFVNKSKTFWCSWGLLAADVDIKNEGRKKKNCWKLIQPWFFNKATNEARTNFIYLTGSNNSLRSFHVRAWEEEEKKEQHSITPSLRSKFSLSVSSYSSNSTVITVSNVASVWRTWRQRWGRRAGSNFLAWVWVKICCGWRG